MKTLEEVWNAIDAGQTVCWNSATYEVLVVGLNARLA